MHYIKEHTTPNLYLVPNSAVGLSMTLFINQPNYIPVLSPQAGVKLLIHKQGEVPQISEKGFNLAPGLKTSIALRYVSLSYFIIHLLFLYSSYILSTSFTTLLHTSMLHTPSTTLPHTPTLHTPSATFPHTPSCTTSIAHLHATHLSATLPYTSSCTSLIILSDNLTLVVR